MPEQPVGSRPAVLDLGQPFRHNPYDAEPHDLAGYGQRRLLDPEPLELPKHVAGARLSEPGPDPAGIDELATFHPSQHQRPEPDERAGRRDVARDHECLAVQALDREPVPPWS